MLPLPAVKVLFNSNSTLALCQEWLILFRSTTVPAWLISTLYVMACN